MTEIIPAQLQSAILTKIRMHHRGWENGIVREKLLIYLHSWWPDLDDRELRRTIEVLRRQGVCSGPHGYFVARNKEDVDASIEYFDKKAMPLLVAKRELRKAYPEYYSGELWELG